jgi:hydrogenase maturation factor
MRNRMAGAQQAGRVEEAVRLRRQLAIGTAAREVHKRLGDLVLTADEAAELIAAVLEHRDKGELEREALEQAAGVQRLVEMLAEALRTGQEPAQAVRDAVQQDALATQRA